MAVISWSKSDCKDGWLHDYKIIAQYPQGVIEGCLKCKDKQYFKVLSGKVANMEYIKYHLRQALPRYHKLFYHEYQNAR